MSIQYDQYLKNHRFCVKKAYAWIYAHLSDFLEENLVDLDVMERRIMSHDTSKDSTEEYTAYDRYFYPEANGVTLDKEINEAFDYAWLHHIHLNPHHWQYWILREDNGGTKPIEMPKEYAVEMVCDWWGFSWADGKLFEVFDWYDVNKENIILHPDTRKFVEELLNAIRVDLDDWK